MKQIALFRIVFAITLIASAISCSEEQKSIEIRTSDGEIAVIDSTDMSERQVEGLLAVSKGERPAQELIAQGLFTQRELTRMGLMAERQIAPRTATADSAGGQGFSGDLGGQGFAGAPDFSSISLDDLNLEGLSDEQVDVLKNLIAGETDFRKVMEESLFTRAELQGIGLFQQMGFGGGDAGGGGLPLGDPGFTGAVDFSSISLDDLNLEGLSDEQVDVLKKLIDGETDFRNVMTEGVFSREELQRIELLPQRGSLGGDRSSGR